MDWVDYEFRRGPDHYKFSIDRIRKDARDEIRLLVRERYNDEGSLLPSDRTRHYFLYGVNIEISATSDLASFVQRLHEEFPIIEIVFAAMGQYDVIFTRLATMEEQNSIVWNQLRQLVSSDYRIESTTTFIAHEGTLNQRGIQ